ncbi:MAG TPA: hypothetical protein VJ455_03230, partial [Ignavibacteria bacterium]|nr:hypothetical protein [Ignavibacteria bacterium]
MKLIKLKKEIHKIIDHIIEPDSLLAIKIFIDTHILHKGDPILSEWQIKRLEESEKQIEQRKFHT